MIAGLILAGGRSTRFGAEKAMALLGGRPLIATIAAKLAGECHVIAVSAAPGSAAAAWAREVGLDALPDPPGLPQGPLTGVLVGLRWAHEIGAKHLATIPCDTPFLPADLIARLTGGRDAEHPAAIAATADGLHPLCAVWRADLGEVFAAALADGRHPPVREVLARLPAREVRFEDAAAFLNVNTTRDLEAAMGRPFNT